MPRFVTCVRCHSTEGNLDAVGLCEACRSRAGQSAVPTPREDGPTSGPPPGLTDTTATDQFADLGATVTADGLTAVALPPQTLSFSNYDLHEIIGRGGMGLVYRATQKRANRVVALKIMAGAAEFDDRQKERFKTEAEAQARLVHPGIVRIYDVGEENGRPYFSMEYVPGGSLARSLRNGSRPGLRESAKIGTAVARAVDAAHGQSVIHRDVKPSNILLGEDGSPKVTDFGLAVLADRDDRVTSSGALLGTPSYMAPEQASGKKGHIGPLTDVYSIGATLYELLTGDPPFKADTMVATAVRVLNDPIVPPRQRNPEVPPVLEAVCLKCLEKEPGKRYTSAAALADDLEAWRDGRPTVARPPTSGQKAGQFIRRYWAVGAAAVLFAGALWLASIGDPKKVIERDFAEGKVVPLIGAKGGPKWSRWETGEVPIDYTLSDEGCFAFQTQTASEVTLMANPRQDEYHLIAEVKHLDAARFMSNCGVYAYSGDVAQSATGMVRRKMKVVYTEFDPRSILGLQVYDESTVIREEKSAQARNLNSSLPFLAMNMRNQSPWRTIVLSVTRFGPEVYWKTDEGYSLVPGPNKASKADLQDGARKSLHRQLVAELKVDLPLPPVWVSGGPVGLIVDDGAAAFRNVVIKPGPFVAP